MRSEISRLRRLHFVEQSVSSMRSTLGMLDECGIRVWDTGVELDITSSNHGAVVVSNSESILATGQIADCYCRLLTTVVQDP